MLEDLGVLNKIDFVQMENLYRYIIPGELDITLKADRMGIIRSLKDRFPQQADAIDRFFDFLYNYCDQWLKVMFMRVPDASRENHPLFFKNAFRSTQEVFDQFFTDQTLKTVLGMYAGYLGLPPSALSFNDMAVTFWLYIEYKPWHIKGGSQAMSSALLDGYLEAGGDVRFNCAAEKIVVHDKKVVAVITESGDEIITDRVVSNASTITTYVDMIDHQHVPDSKWRELGSRSVGMSTVIVFMGFDCEPDELDIFEATNFISSTLDDLLDSELSRTLNSPKSVLFSCYDVDDPEFSPKGSCQGALLTSSYLEPWLKVPPARYFEFKNLYAQQLLELLYQVFPKCEDHIEEMEISTPLTNMRYLGHPGGAIYGFDQFTKDNDLFLKKKSPINGLYHVGSWAGMGGFQPTIQSGYSMGNTIIQSLRKTGKNEKILKKTD